jgi:hypothetical protein
VLLEGEDCRAMGPGTSLQRDCQTKYAPPSRHTYAQTLFSVDFAGKMTCLSSVEETFPL